MKTIRFFAMLLTATIIVGCSDSFTPLFESNLDNKTLFFVHKGGEQSFIIESNEQWSIDELPGWITVNVQDVKDTQTRSTSYEKGTKEVTVTVEANEKHQSRSANINMTSSSGINILLSIKQDKKPELIGYWILSEGYAGQNNSELAYYDIASDELKKKQFEAINGLKLGDTGNELKQYGSKMYCLVSGPGFGNSTPEGEAYIEVINPLDGKSLKRIAFKDSEGVTSKPRKMVCEEGKIFVSSYGNEVVRIDTLSLEIDGHAKLTGTFAEGLTYNNGNIYVCNSGQGADNKISVVDAKTMEETKVITSPMNPTGIVTVSDKEIIFNTNYPGYEVYKLNLENDSYEKINNMYGSDISLINNNVYTCFFDWTTYEDMTYKYDITSGVSNDLELDLSSVGISMLMGYHIGTINDTEDLYLSGMGEDVVIFNPITLDIKLAFKMGLAGASGVVAVYN